jgi:hypothetical protein
VEARVCFSVFPCLDLEPSATALAVGLTW